MLRPLGLLILVLLLLGCGRTGRLYPANDTAAASGVLTMHFTSYGTGRGPVEIPMPDGEVLKGEYTLVRGGAVGFGSIYGLVYGPGGTTTGTATATSYAVPGGSPGMVSAFGDRGTAMQCEVYNDNFSGHGYGACRSSKGALYRLQY
jgi:hypothetical protein